MPTAIVETAVSSFFRDNNLVHLNRPPIYHNIGYRAECSLAVTDLSQVEEQPLMSIGVGNILADIPRNLAKEQFIELLSAPHLRIERIVSIGHSSPPGHFDDQDWAEWVMVLQGAAKVLFEAEVEPRVLRSGDYLHIAAHARHRVEWTSLDEPTVWLAIHSQPDCPGA
jgi:cupin 2 domain-containing protein